jgi:predicted nucleic acid-binding protein
MPSNRPKFRIYWDSCLFIARIQRDKRYIALLEQITESAKDREVQICTSAMAIVETLGNKNSKVSIESQEKEIEAFFRNRWISVVPVSRRLAVEGTRIARRHSMTAPDGVHVATALAEGIPLMQTYDEPHLLTKDKKMGGDPTLRILKPSLTFDPSEKQTKLLDVAEAWESPDITGEVDEEDEASEKR